MKYYNIEEVYETVINGVTYCFRYENPTTRNNGKSFSGVAQAWKKDVDTYFTVPYYVKSENIDMIPSEIAKGIKEIVEK